MRSSHAETAARPTKGAKMVDTREATQLPSTAPLDLERLRYPAEPSRLAMAVVCVACALTVVVVWLVIIDLSSLILGVAVLVIAGVLLWAALQLGRLRLLGNAVLVTAETFPDVQSAVDEVRAMLQYERRVDIFVVPNLSPRIQLTSYFGIRALLFEGGAIADITAPASRPQLLFLLGTYFGAFKAKHDRWAVTEFVLDNAGIRTILAPFVAPWLRTTIYTGDQIAYACSRDFRVSLAAVFRVLVGRELSPQLAVSGLIIQAARVSRSPVLRVAEMFRPVPHATNRFLNLVRFAQQADPESVLAFRGELSHDVNGKLDEALAQITRAGRRNLAPALVTLGAVVLSTILVFLGFQATSSGSQVSAEDPVPPGSEAIADDPTAEATEDPSVVEIDCWDGSTSDSGVGCPVLTGEAALLWVYDVGAASCSTSDSTEYAPAGAVSVMMCSWSDLPGTVAYLTEWTSPDASRWDEYFAQTSATTEKSEWTLDTVVTGPAWYAAFLDVDDNLTALDKALAYADSPFAVEFYSDVALGGGVEAIADAESRMSFKKAEFIAEAQASAG